MNETNLISILFYLTEAIKYSPPQTLTRLENEVLELTRLGFESTGNLSFKTYHELKTQIPETMFHRAKDSFKKNSSIFYMSFSPSLVPQEIVRKSELIPTYKGTEMKYSESMDLLGGTVKISLNESNYYEKISMSVEFLKCKRNDEQDFQKLVDRLRFLMGR